MLADSKSTANACIACQRSECSCVESMQFNIRGFISECVALVATMLGHEARLSNVAHAAR